ncbi:MAG: hypothetical protein IKV76_00820, partial [Clostridia bacterium]|nr:hypothetical protein [Clostridia bacterium]
MKKAFKKAVAVLLCAVMTFSVCVMNVGAAEAEAEIKTDCSGNCEYSPVIVLPGINHSPTYLYDENDEPVMYNGTHIGSTLLILNEEALSVSAIIKLVIRVI